MRFTSSSRLVAHRALLLSGAVTFAAAQPAFAQTAAPTPAPAPMHQADHYHDLPNDIIVTAAPFQRSELDVLGGTSVVQGIELDRDMRASIGDTLASQPGVSATSFGPGASRPVLRGFQGDRIRVLTDGIGSIDASSSSVDHAVAINPLTANRIEVLRGPSALLYGSSAIGGVVNVLDDRIPRSIPDEPIHLDVMGTYGTAAKERSVAGVLDVPLGSMFVAHVDGSYIRADDLRTGGFINSRAIREDALHHAEEDGNAELAEEANARGRIDNTSLETWEVAGGLSLVTDRGHLGFSLSRYESNYGVPNRFDPHGHEEHEDHGDEEHGDEDHGDHDEHEGHAHEDVRLAVKQTRFDIRGEVETNGGFLDRIRLRLGAADYRHDELEDNGEIGTSFFNQGYEGRLELVQADRDGWRGALGGQFVIRDFEIVGEEKYMPKTTTEQMGLFTLQSVDLGAFRAEAGARYEHSRLSANADDDIGNPAIDRTFNAFSGSVGASTGLGDGVRAGLNLSRTERAPSAEELFSGGPHAATQAFEIGDPTLAKEASWGVEGTFRLSRPGFRIAASAYYNWFDNYIYQFENDDEIDELPVFAYAQSDARVRGFEVEASATLARMGGTAFNVDGLVDYVVVDVDDFGPAPRIPPLRVLGGVEAQADMFNARLEAEHVFEQDRVAGVELPTDSYTMVNASVAFSPFGTGNSTRLIVSANNIFDVEARRHASQIKDFAPLAGRDIRATLRFQL
ncbi:TonB-dependent receptor [Sphingomonas sp. AX6]|uniref:TonB-dependent receptor n=1 Tax=Sphingomonas sp. AX6 TaxID=2653171 RepID=UPI0012F1D8AB|nr:TonB-dependent receptor [Sphingomonas sp. AX6]VXC82908.1 TonB-dependent receptor [Sphingomonas sp. AX6]